MSPVFLVEHAKQDVSKVETKARSRRNQTVWVIMHYEIMGLPDSTHVDSVQFQVASSLEMAEEYIRGVRVASYSWWQVHPHVVDHDDFPEGEEVYFFSHRGTRLKAAPITRSMTAFRKYVARHPERWPLTVPGQ